MKQTKILQLIGCISFFIASSSAIAQSGKTANSFNPKFITEGSAEVSGSEDDDLASINRLKMINIKMHKDFTRHFGSATNIKMSTVSDHTVINCSMEGIKTRVLYNGKGRWVNTLRYLTTEQIPYDVADLVSSEFRKFKITGATEVIVPAGSAILVRIENERSFQTIRVVGDTYDIYEKHLKVKEMVK